MLAFGGATPGATSGTAETESWNGSSWTEVSDLNTARRNVGSAGISNTSALCFGGQLVPSPVTAVNELWNGSTWTETTDLSTAREQLGSAGIQTSAIAFGGAPFPSVSVATEEFTGAGTNNTVTFTVS